MLIPGLQIYANAQPMRVVRVCTIDDDSCYGKYFESFEFFILLFNFFDKKALVGLQCESSICETSEQRGQRRI
jgi:hypothetical protein